MAASFLVNSLHSYLSSLKGSPPPAKKIYFLYIKNLKNLFGMLPLVHLCLQFIFKKLHTTICILNALIKITPICQTKGITVYQEQTRTNFVQ